MKTYKDRRITVTAIRSIDGGAVTREDGWTQGVPDDVVTKLRVGQSYVFETRGISNPTGIQDPVTEHWFYRKSDQDLDREHQEFREQLNRDREERWAANKDDWSAREAQLSSPLRRRLDRFRINGGHDFEINGWGYELTICELAMLYVDSGGEDDEAVMTFSREQGTSGNQHDYAKVLARYLRAEEDDIVANSVSALSPITGDADYSGAAH